MLASINRHENPFHIVFLFITKNITKIVNFTDLFSHKIHDITRFCDISLMNFKPNHWLIHSHWTKTFNYIQPSDMIFFWFRGKVIFLDWRFYE